MNSLTPFEQLVSEWNTFSAVKMPLDQDQLPEQTSFEPPFHREVERDAPQRHAAAVLFLTQQNGISHKLIAELHSEMESLTGDGAKLDGGRHMARAAIRAEALAYGYVDLDAVIMDGVYLRAVDYTE